MVRTKNRILESSLSKILDYNNKFDCGTITAFRNNYTKSENYQRNGKLKAQLVLSEYTVIAGKGEFLEKDKDGKDIPVSEDMFYVVDKNNTGDLKDFLLKLGEEWEQDSILFMPKGMMLDDTIEAEIIGTSKSDSVEPKYHESFNLSNSEFGKTGKYYSTRINGRPFFLESITPIEKPQGNMLKWSLSLIVEKDWREYK